MSENEKDINQNATPEQVLSTVADIKRAIEAILFAAGYPVRYDKLAEVLGLSEKDVKTLLDDMSPDFNDESSPRGLRLLLLPETAQLCTKEKYVPYIREALGIRRGGNLSASSLEVLAVVAYNQPVTRAFIDQVRGVDSSYAVNSLIDKALIESCGRLDAPGRPMLYATTDKFLRVFGFNSLDDLPATEPLVDPNAKRPEDGEVLTDGAETAEEAVEEAVEAIDEVDDGDVKLAEGHMVAPEKPSFELSPEGSDDSDDETGGEIENSIE